MKICNCWFAKYLNYIFFKLYFIFPILSQITYHNYYNFFTDSVLRINILRTGNYHYSSFTIHSFSVDAFWSGSRTKLIETFDYGTFKINVYDSTTNQLIFNRSWSSLFSEYIYTNQGNIQSKTFEEVIRLPYPRRTIKIVFYERKNHIPIWHKTDSIFFNPTNINNLCYTLNYHAIVEKVFDAGKPQNTMDIVFVADNYEPDLISKFFNDVRRVAKYLIDCEPYNAYRTNISIWAVFPKITNSDSSKLCSFNTFGLERYIMTEKVFLLHDYITQVPFDHIVILVNTNQYGGGGIYNFYATCPSDHSLTNFLITHETGHSIAGLADEYWTSEVSVNNFYNLQFEPWEPNITTLVNFEKKWKKLLDTKTPIPTPIHDKSKYKIGVFEGAGYSEKGIYRPSFECSMKSAIYNNFCPVCKESIKKIIEFYTK